jgi:MFS-type transporter involved in bile tolerance (Atg22 family)
VVFRNKPYLVLLFSYMLYLSGLNFLSGILVYYMKYILNDEALTTPAMLLLLVIAMVFIPISVILSKHIGKKKVYQLCFGIMATACMGIFFLGHRTAPGVTLGLMALAGIGLGFGYVPPFAMLPDAIEAEAVLDRQAAGRSLLWYLDLRGQARAVPCHRGTGLHSGSSQLCTRSEPGSGIDTCHAIADRTHTRSGSGGWHGAYPVLSHRREGLCRHNGWKGSCLMQATGSELGRGYDGFFPGLVDIQDFIDADQFEQE